jgi:hypothetical protein
LNKDADFQLHKTIEDVENNGKSKAQMEAEIFNVEA